MYKTYGIVDQRACWDIILSILDNTVYKFDKKVNTADNIIMEG